MKLSLCYLALFVSESSGVTAFLPVHQVHSPTVLRAKAKAKEEVVNYKKADLLADWMKETDMSKAEADDALKTLLGLITSKVNDGQRLSLPGFGTFTLKQRAARKGRNPKTGEELDIAASVNPSFSVSKTWKDQANGRA